MRTPLFAILVALRFLFASGEAQADSFFHLPCDPDAGFSFGGGVFKGHTRTTGIGNVSFERIILGAPRLELTLFENCGRNDDHRPRVTRWWLGRLNIFGALVSERVQLSLRNPVAGVPRATSSGDTLTQADIERDRSLSYGFGARMSLIDASHFHVEAYYEQTGTFGWQDADTKTVIAYVNGSDIDVTSLVETFASVAYRFTTRSYGLTIGVPLKPNTRPRLRVTPFVTFGRMQLAADVIARFDPDFAELLNALGIDAADVATPRSVRKSSWSANGGARFDVNDHLSFEASLAYGQTPSTTIYVGMLTMTVRFRTPKLRDLGRATIPLGGLPF